MRIVSRKGRRENNQSQFNSRGEDARFRTSEGGMDDLDNLHGLLLNARVRSGSMR
jgi:hypothetical protein